MYINLKFDEIHLCGLKFSTTYVNDNDNIINIPKYQYMRSVVGLYLVTFSAAMGQIPRSTELFLLIK